MAGYGGRPVLTAHRPSESLIANRVNSLCIRAKLLGMGVSARRFETFLCDACGREIIAEEGSRIDGFYIDVTQIARGEMVGEDNVYACSDICLERAIRDSLKRATLPHEAKLTATQELWLKGRAYSTNPELPIVDVSDETRVIGTAREILPPSPTKREP